MKLIYTDIRSSLTGILAKEAERLANANKQVFYIAPNSLSFEKERQVLSLLEHQASFAITVTRFSQMARYFVLNEAENKQILDDIGLGMMVYKVLSEMDPSELKIYGQMKTNPQFIQQVVDLYHELQEAQMSFADLQYMKEEAKREDLLRIFQALNTVLNQQQFESESKLMRFSQQILSGHLDADLSHFAIVVDGFSRFSAEESYLISLLHNKGVEIVIGTYASQRAYEATFIEGNLYQASVDFLRQLAKDYQVKPEYITDTKEEDTFAKVTRLLESHYDFSEVDVSLTEEEKEKIQIWSTASQKEELEAVAKAIRQKVESGVRYKEIRLLLGDVEAYRLQLQTIFSDYQIPFYLGRSESMGQHPLVQFFESLYRLKQYNYRAEDVLNLLKTGLYGSFTQEEQDQFDQYIRFADIQGKAAFSRDFVHHHHHKFNLYQLNQIRKRFMNPLLDLFKTRSQSVTGLLKKFYQFLETTSLPYHLAQMVKDEHQQEKERQEEVWKAFCHVLEQFEIVFKDGKVTLDDVLALLQSGMLLSHYRTIPATVDVVLVQSYDLIEPLSASYVYAVGLTQDHFPKLAQTKGLLTEEEQRFLNEQTADEAEFMIASSENGKKNRFAALSLFNAATKELVLSTPQVVNELESTLSSYLAELTKEPIALKIQTKSHSRRRDLGTYRALFAQVVEQYRKEIVEQYEAEMSGETIWAVAVRVLRQKLQDDHIQIPSMTKVLKTEPLSYDTLQILYPVDQPLILSTSALTEFYRHQYAYFLKYVLRLQEELTIHPDARSHGNFLHRIFEKVTQQTEEGFDTRLEKAIYETRQEAEFLALYSENAQAQFIQELLLDTAHATAQALVRNQEIETVQEEAVFGFDSSSFLTLADGRPLLIRGKVDRIDRLKETGSLGIVDYKSSELTFNFPKFFNGLHSQLPTYLAAVAHEKWEKENPVLFGAMYLQMTDPIIALKNVKNEGEILKEARKPLEYKGLFLENQVPYLGASYQRNKVNQLTKDELDILLAYNALLYRRAAEGILSGHFKVNPYTEDGRSIAPFVEQYKAITGFEANLHLGQARLLQKLDSSQYEKRPVGEKLRQAWIEKMKEELEK